MLQKITEQDEDIAVKPLIIRKSNEPFTTPLLTTSPLRSRLSIEHKRARSI